MGSDLRVYPDLEALSRAAAESLVELAAAAAAQTGCFSIALAGGQTPRRLYQLLATDYRGRTPWPGVEVFWGDERYVPHDDPRSDYQMARETLLAAVPLPRENIHPMPTDAADPEEAAQAYESVLRAHFPSRPWPRFDLVLLGLGAEGHTASLFPGSPALVEERRWVVAAEVPVAPPRRLTLTLPAINHARHIYFLAAGAGKREALAQALAETPDVARCPAAGVRPVEGEVVWWVDEAARGGPGATSEGTM